jgi:hypothetical protein
VSKAIRPSAPHRRTSPSLLLAASVCGATMIVGCGADPVDGLDGDDDGDSGAATFTSIYNSSEFQKCRDCHAPGAPGRTAGIETTQNWSTKDAAYNSIKTGRAMGLTGNFSGCNGVALIGSTPESSLLVAALDEDVRADFMSSSAANCDGDAISDMTLKIGGPVSSATMSRLKAWIAAGAPNN